MANGAVDALDTPDRADPVDVQEVLLTHRTRDERVADKSEDVVTNAQAGTEIDRHWKNHLSRKRGALVFALQVLLMLTTAMMGSCCFHLSSESAAVCWAAFAHIVRDSDTNSQGAEVAVQSAVPHRQTLD